MSAGQAPQGFGVEEVVEPRMWVVHYKGQVVAPMDGVYRLAGYADDFIAGRINGARWGATQLYSEKLRLGTTGTGWDESRHRENPLWKLGIVAKG